MTARPLAQPELVVVRAGTLAADDAAVGVQHRPDRPTLDLAGQRSQAVLLLLVAGDLCLADQLASGLRLGALRTDLLQRQGDRHDLSPAINASRQVVNELSHQDRKSVV